MKDLGKVLIEQPRKKELINAILYVIIQSFLIGWFMTYVAWKHNPQGIIRDLGNSETLVYIFITFISWFFGSLVVGVLIFICVYLVRIFIRYVVLIVVCKKNRHSHSL
jgi:hypothetical protein